jgi:LysR family transcriptional regulator, regulator for bpeEF and oprC
MQTFVRVAERRSFSAAARELGRGQPAVSKQIAALEAHLGAQLLRRTSRGLSLTEAGRDYYQSAVGILGDLQAAESRVGLGQSAPSGLVRVAVSAGFGRLHVMPLLPAFLERYPRITLDFQVSDRFVDLVEEGIDVAVRLGNLSDSSLIARRLATFALCVVATPEYLRRRGVPAVPADVERHDCIVFSPKGAPARWPFAGAGGSVVVEPRSVLRTNDAELVRAGVLAGLGLGYAQTWLFAAELASGRVRTVLGEFTRTTVPISAVHPAGRRLPRKVAVFIEYLAAAFAADPTFSVRQPGHSVPE